MAYRSFSRRGGSRGSGRTRASSSYRRSGSRSGYTARASRSKRSARSRVTPQTVRIVLETREASPVSRPELTGAQLIEKPARRAKF